ncbi:MAG: YecH family metal-binding protein [Prevotella sp.]|jgi:probable metal-binding protein
MIHGHEVIQMMEGNSYPTRESLIKAITDKFGADAQFHTCSAEGLNAEQLVDFLEQHGKFMPAGNSGFTVDKSKVCNH